MDQCLCWSLLIQLLRVPQPPQSLVPTLPMSVPPSSRSPFLVYRDPNGSCLNLFSFHHFQLPVCHRILGTVFLICSGSPIWTQWRSALCFSISAHWGGSAPSSVPLPAPCAPEGPTSTPDPCPPSSTMPYSNSAPELSAFTFLQQSAETEVRQPPI